MHDCMKQGHVWEVDYDPRTKHGYEPFAECHWCNATLTLGEINEMLTRMSRFDAEIAPRMLHAITYGIWERSE